MSWCSAIKQLDYQPGNARQELGMVKLALPNHSTTHCSNKSLESLPCLLLSLFLLPFPSSCASGLLEYNTVRVFIAGPNFPRRHSSYKEAQVLPLRTHASMPPSKRWMNQLHLNKNTLPVPILQQSFSHRWN